MNWIIKLVRSWKVLYIVIYSFYFDERNISQYCSSKPEKKQGFYYCFVGKMLFYSIAFILFRTVYATSIPIWFKCPYLLMDVCVTKWKSENTTVRIVPKYNRNNRWNGQKLIPPNTHTQDRSLSWTGTDTSIRSHTVKLVLWANIFSTSLWFCITNNCWIMRTIWHVQRKQTPANGLL